MSGQTVLKQTYLNQQLVQLSAASLPAGNYVVTIAAKNGNAVAQQKISINH